MIYALNLSEDGRILSVTYDEYAPPEQPRTDTQPDGDVSEYKYVDGEFVHEPLPKPPEPEPEAQQGGGGDVTYSELAAAIREGVNSYGQ